MTLLPPYPHNEDSTHSLICHVLSATIHPDLKRTLVTISERTGMSVSQVTDEVLYKGLVGMQEIDEL